MKNFSLIDLDVDYDVEPLEEFCNTASIYKRSFLQVQTLKEIAAKKLLSDVFLMRCFCGQVPKTLHTYLLNNAISLRRTLSIAYLLKYYPYEEFIYPLPENWNTWTVFCEDFKKGKGDIDVIFRNNAQILLSTFFSIIKEKLKLPLRAIDMNYLSVEGTLIRDKLWAEKLRPGRCNKESSHSLRIPLVIKSDLELKSLCRAIDNTTFISKLKVIITGLNFNSFQFEEKCVLSLLDLIDSDELQMCSLDFCNIRPSLGNSLLKLQKFTNLRAFSLSYVLLDFRHNPILLNALSQTLNNLPHISRVSLQGCTLKGCLPDLFQNVCRSRRFGAKRQKPDSNSNCCIVHRGTLQYLNISCCGLVNEDLAYFRELHLCKTLRNLDISCNSFSAECLAQCLEPLGSSLVVLYMDRCILKTSNLISFILDLDKMKKLKCLRMGGLHFNIDDLTLLANKIDTMPHLKCVSVSLPTNWRTLFHDQVEKLRDRKSIKVSWHQISYSIE